MSRRIVALVVVGAAALVSCSTDEPAPPAKAPTTATSTLTREQGAKRYLELVAPSNAALEKCLPVLNPLRTSGESTPSDFPKLRKACAEVPETNREFADALSKVSWPAEAQDSVNQLVDELRAGQLGWEGVAKAQNYDDLFDPKYPLPDDGPAAGLVRAHLGLPSTEE